MSQQQPQSHGKLALKLVGIVVGMFGFGFALVPLYDVICDITGLGGRTGDQYTYDPATMTEDRSRLVKVNFITNTNGGMPHLHRRQCHRQQLQQQAPMRHRAHN